MTRTRSARMRVPRPQCGEDRTRSKRAFMAQFDPKLPFADPLGGMKPISKTRTKRLFCPSGIVGQPAHGYDHQFHEQVKTECRAAIGKIRQEGDEDQCGTNDSFDPSVNPKWQLSIYTSMRDSGMSARIRSVQMRLGKPSVSNEIASRAL